MTDKVNTYWAKFKVDSSEFKGGVEQATASFVSFYSQVTIAAEMTMQIIGRITSAIGEMADEVRRIQNLSIQLGMTTEEIQRLQWAAIYAGADFDRFDEALNKFVLAIGRATVATTEQAQAFKALNVDPSGRTTSEVFDEVMRKLEAIEDPTKRNTIATKMFGESVRYVIPLIDGYSDSMDKAKDATILSDATQTQLLNADKNIKALTKTVWEFGVMSVGTVVDPKFWEALGKQMIDPLAMLNYFKEVSTPEATKESTKAVYENTNAYAGLTDTQIELKDAITARDAALGELVALEKSEPALYNAKAKELQLLENRVRSLTQAEKEEAEQLAKNAAAASTTGPTYNTMFASQLAGTVGPDWGGYGALASMTAEQLQAIVDSPEGKSKSYIEKAQQYLSMMTANPKAAAAMGIGAAVTTTDPKVKEAADRQSKINDAIQKGYDNLQKMTLDHETRLAEYSRIKYQAILEYAAEAVNFAGSHPIIQKSAILSKSGYDIDISPLPTVVAPILKAADFGQGSVPASAASAGSENKGGTTNNNNVTVNITTKDSGSSIKGAVTQGIADGLAKGGAV